MADRRRLVVFAVAVAMLLSPAAVLAQKPVRVTTCAVSTGVTQSSVKSKGTTTVTVTGTTGQDTIDCSAISKGGVVINGHGGGDAIVGTEFADSIDDGAIGGGWTTSVIALGGNDIIHVGWGDITSSSNASVDGGAGDDQIVANGGYVDARGGDGNDLIDLSRAYAANADGETGNDTISGPLAAQDPNTCFCVNTLFGGAGDDSVTGGTGHDELYGGDGLDSMHGGPGPDVLTDYGSGAETFDCGDGTDLADDYDGNGVGTDGTVGYLNAPEDDFHLSNCEEVRVASSAP